VGPEEYKLMLDAVRQDWERQRDVYCDAAAQAAAGLLFDDARIAALREDMDRSLNDFIRVAKQLQDEILFKTA
jgi:hypothetical protein